VAFGREALDIRRTSSRTVGARLGTRELGHVPGAPQEPDDAYRVPTLDDPDGATAALYRSVAERLAEEAERASARVIVVTGAVEDDHGEQVAANLAVALASAGARVAIVETDSGRPVLRRLFALERGPGLGEVFSGRVALEEALAPAPGLDRLMVLTAGEGPMAAPLETVLESLRATFELVIVCSPPLLRPRRRSALPPADGVLLAVNLHSVRRSRIVELRRRLRGVRLLGSVIVSPPGSGQAPQEPPVRIAG
jgi:tyrosine-protein kinase